jgi:hypothetical protein
MLHFQSQIFAQQIQSSTMKQVADYTSKNLGCCPTFFVSQELVGTKLEVLIRFTLEHSNETTAAAVVGQGDKEIPRKDLFESLSASTTILDASPTLLGGIHVGNLFSPLTGLMLASCGTSNLRAVSI